MIKKEYERLIRLLGQSIQDSSITLEVLLQEAVAFFEALRKEFPKAAREEQEEMVIMMNTLHERLQQMSKLTAKAAGMTEEELEAYAENPSNFTPEQWQAVQRTRQDLYDSARKFSTSIGKGKTPEGEPPKKGRPPIGRRSRRKDWTKS